jgi:hypothetical protein
MPKDLVKDIGIDLSWVAAFGVTFLPFIQTVLGVAIAVVILLINILRYKKLRREAREEKKKD